jgi:hypothetical protein
MVSRAGIAIEDPTGTLQLSSSGSIRIAGECLRQSGTYVAQPDFVFASLRADASCSGGLDSADDAVAAALSRFRFEVTTDTLRVVAPGDIELGYRSAR